MFSFINLLDTHSSHAGSDRSLSTWGGYTRLCYPDWAIVLNTSGMLGSMYTQLNTFRPSVLRL